MVHIVRKFARRELTFHVAEMLHFREDQNNRRVQTETVFIN